LDDTEIQGLLSKDKTDEGWGETQTIRYQGTKIFVKKVPLTGVEYQNKYSLKNHFRLPLYYNFGINSAGFGAYRELNAHIKTTNWVLAGETDSFPLLYHYRVIRRISKIRNIDENEHRDYIKYWNSSKSIDAFIKERNNSEYELLLFIEHFPHVLGFGKWFSKNTHRIDEISNSCFKAIEFLKSKGMVHMDLQFHNIVTDNEDFYFTDFGLTLDKQACVSEKEKAFYKSVSFLDYHFFLSSASWHLNYLYEKSRKTIRNKIDELCCIDKGMEFLQVTRQLVLNLERLNEEIMKLDPTFYNYILKHRESILEANSFLVAMYKNTKKNTPLINTEIRRALAIG